MGNRNHRPNLRGPYAVILVALVAAVIGLLYVLGVETGRNP